MSLCLFLISLHLDWIDLPTNLAVPVSFFHQACLSQIPKSIYFEISEALVCGKRISDPGLRTTLASTGLIHLFVVSGLHLNLLSRCFNFATVAKPLEIPLLFVYALTSGANPPVVRAFLQKVVSLFKLRFEMHWPADITIWHTSFITLILSAQWIHSFSFLLSWSAMLGISLFKRHNILSQHFGIYLVMFPVLSQISSPHPASIFITMILGTLIGSLIFPLAIFSLLIPALSHILDTFWAHVLPLLEHLSRELPNVQSQLHTTRWPSVIYLLLLHFGILLYRYLRPAHEH